MYKSLRLLKFGNADGLTKQTLRSIIEPEHEG